MVSEPPEASGETHNLTWSDGFVHDAELSVTAVPPTGFTFDHWSGDVPAGHEADNPLLLIMDCGREIVVHWQSPPALAAHIDEVSPNPQIEGNPVHFAGSGEGGGGQPIVAYEWRYAVNGVAQQFGDQPEFDYWDFSAGEYEILLRVQSGDGTWSPWAEWDGNPLTITSGA
ncbi:MAG: InlB B-repeat-containing protein [Armatimonadota bacterium]